MTRRKPSFCINFCPAASLHLRSVNVVSPRNQSSILCALRVIILITPPSIKPYKEDIGPRTTSIRSIAGKGGNQPCSIPELSLLERVSRDATRHHRPRFQRYTRSSPRILISERYRPCSAPRTSFSASVTSRYDFVSNCSRVTTETSWSIFNSLFKSRRLSPVTFGDLAASSQNLMQEQQRQAQFYFL